MCDDAISEIFSSGVSPAGQDLYSLLESFVTSKGNDLSSSAVLFWQDLHRLPPIGIQVSDKDTVLAQQFYLDCAVQISQALLYYSLAGGFAR